MKLLSLMSAVMLLAGCALPITTVKTGSSPPTLVVQGAPKGSILFVDGLAMGNATQYDGHPDTLAVLDGTHQVEIRQGNSVIYKEAAFASPGQSHTVVVSQAASR